MAILRATDGKLFRDSATGKLSRSPGCTVDCCGCNPDFTNTSIYVPVSWYEFQEYIPGDCEDRGPYTAITATKQATAGVGATDFEYRGTETVGGYLLEALIRYAPNIPIGARDAWWTECSWEMFIVILGGGGPGFAYQRIDEDPLGAYTLQASYIDPLECPDFGGAPDPLTVT